MIDSQGESCPVFESGKIISRYDKDGKIFAFLDEIEKYNKKVNLVSRETSRAGLEAFAADSLIPLELIPDLSGTFFDIGPGGGFPSVVLMLARPDLAGVLVERTAKKAAFLRQVVARFNLKAEIRCHNFGDTVSGLKRGSFCFGLMKYVRLQPPLLKAALELLTPGGQFIHFAPPDKPTGKTDERSFSVSVRNYYLDDLKRLHTLSMYTRNS